MNFVFYNGEREINGDFPGKEYGYKYAENHGLKVIYVEPDLPSEEDDVNSMLVDHEYRLALLELGIDNA